MAISQLYTLVYLYLHIQIAITVVQIRSELCFDYFDNKQVIWVIIIEMLK